MDRDRRRRLLISSLILGAVAVVGLVLFLSVPDLRESVPKTASSWFRVLGYFGALTVFAALVIRFVRPRWLATTVAVVPLLAFSTWALAPAFYDRTVNEDFPEVAAVADGPDGSEEPSPSTSAAPAASTSAPDATSAAPDPTSANAGTTPPPTSAPTGTPTTDPSTTTPSPTTTATNPPPTDQPSSEPTLLGSGSLRGLTGHDASGQAFLWRLADGSVILRFENLDVSRAPDLHVYLVPGSDQTSTNGGVRLGKLKGNKGNQNYSVPDSVDPDDFDGVLIWCKKFTVEVAASGLT